MRRFPWLPLLMLLVGAALGIYYSWILSPVQYVDTTPDSLRSDFKDRFRSSVAAAYAATGNLERARARLELLHDASSVEALNAQAQRMLAAGDPYGSVEQVAQLSADLQAGAPVVLVPSPTPTREPLHTPTDTPAASGPTETLLSEQTAQPTEETPAPPEVLSSPTARPTRTPTARPGLPYGLVSQDTLCDATLSEGLLQVIVTDTRRRQVAGREVIASWDGGEEHFFTGLKPELGDGYADFIMQAGTLYSVRVASGGTPISDVTPPSCTARDGTVTAGQIKLTFQQGK